MPDRRRFLACAVATLFAPRLYAASGGPQLSVLEPFLAALEKEAGGRLGVAVLDTQTGLRVGYRDQERFPMCSTFKALLVAAVLAKVDGRKEHLDRVVQYGRADLLSYAPVTEKHLESGMTISALCEAAITLSDNTAANLLLATIGGPVGLTSYALSLGDRMTRLDRNEPALNSAIPGDPRDTTTPAAMLATLRKLTLGTALSVASRQQLNDWLAATQTGVKKLKAGLPPSWKEGDKTGSGDHNTSNDIAILYPPGRKPILIAAYFTGSSLDADHTNQIFQRIGRELSELY